MPVWGCKANLDLQQYLFPKDDSPKYIMGFSVISAMLAVGVVVFLFLHIWFRRRLREGII